MPTTDNEAHKQTGNPLFPLQLHYVRYGAREILSESELSTHVLHCRCVWVQLKTRIQTCGNLPGRNNHLPAACVIAQQYSSTTFVLLRSHSREKKIGSRFQKKLYLFLLFQNWNTFNFVTRGGGVCNSFIPKLFQATDGSRSYNPTHAITSPTQAITNPTQAITSPTYTITNPTHAITKPPSSRNDTGSLQN